MGEKAPKLPGVVAGFFGPVKNEACFFAVGQLLCSAFFVQQRIQGAGFRIKLRRNVFIFQRYVFILRLYARITVV